VVKRRNVMLWDGGSGYRAYVFKESTRRYAIDRKSRGRKEVIYKGVTSMPQTPPLLVWYTK
jgi:hypothetical protein